MINLAELKKLGAIIRYDRIRQTYYYDQGCCLKFGFELALQVD